MEELNFIEIGKRVKVKRKEKNLTQEKLSEIIDVSPSYVSEIERGTSICSLSIIVKIASALECNLDYLIFGITSKNSDTTFKELIDSIPNKKHKLFISLCEAIANTLKE
jgi:transcriptional regulator with XRE-family HTH domain